MSSIINYRIFISIITAVIVTISFCQNNKQRDHIIFYDKPAEDWMTQAIPIGNGYIGAMFFGGIHEERIQFSEGSLWSGGPGSNLQYNYGIRKNARQNLAKIRNLLKDNKKNEASSLLAKTMTGQIDRGDHYNGDFGDYGAQQTMGDIFIKIKNHDGKIENYQRSLNISKGTAKVQYEIDNIQYERTYFGNYPHNVMVYRFESQEPCDYIVYFKTPHSIIEQDFSNNTLTFSCRVKDNNMKFETRIIVKAESGEVTYSDNVIKITQSTSFHVENVAETENDFRFPHYNGNDYIEKNNLKASILSNLSYSELYQEHLDDYTKLFKRVDLNLGENKYSRTPTNVRLKNYYAGNDDSYFEALYFQYARYLMISASRPGTASMHLQGKWNNSINPPWASDYHSNINLEMIYWPAEITNLSQCHLPFLSYIESLVPSGKLAAREFFNAPGWICNTMCNAFGYTSPGWGMPWGYFPAGAAWFSQHFWFHYTFNKDTVFLKNRAYPVMKEAAKFWLDYLIEDEEGYLVSCPSYSPEHGGISKGASMDHQIVWELFNNCLQAAKTLNIEDDFIKKIRFSRDKILPPRIGKWGQLQEWKEDIDDPENHHRHVSHLFALHPGSQISLTRTPQLAKAAEKSLRARGDGGTGWSRAWKINFWARLKDGDHARKMLKELLKPVSFKGYEMKSGGGTYSNLLCAHPPFQIDGNMGGCSGIAEMLLQSQNGILEILPALPSCWKTGEIKGLKGRGAYTVNIKWRESRLEKLEIIGRPEESVEIKIQDSPVERKTIPSSGVLVINK